MRFLYFLESEEQKTLILMRGIPGSGKSYKAQSLKGDSGVIFSTDDFWGDNYRAKFDQAVEDGTVHHLLGRFHQQNLERTIQAMDQGVSPVIVDNTNVRLRDMKPYIDAAEQRGYQVRYEESDLPQWKDYRQGRMSQDDAVDFFSRNNSHGVPPETIRGMMRKFADIPQNESSLRDRLEPIPQSPKWHKEGNVFRHTQLVRKAMKVAIDLLTDAAADPSSAFSELDMNLTQEDINLLRSSAWMHDIGKAGATTIGDEKRPNTYIKGTPLDQYDQPVDIEKDKISAVGHEKPKYFEPQMQKLGSGSMWHKMYDKVNAAQKDDLWFAIQGHMSLGSNGFNKIKNSLVDAKTGKYINDRKIKILLLLILMDQMGRFGDGESQFGLANGLQALKRMQYTADQMKADFDKRNTKKANPFDTPEALRAHLQSVGMSPAEIEKNVARKFTEPIGELCVLPTGVSTFMEWLKKPKVLNEMGITTQDQDGLRTIITKLMSGDMNWMDQHDIKVGDKGAYWILNYGMHGKNEYNRLARGLVVQKPQRDFSGDVLQLIKSFPFIRFFNQGEPQADSINLNNAEMLEKMDGTMVGVFFPSGDPNDPHWHTRNMLSSHEPDLNLKVGGFGGGEHYLMQVIGQYVKRLNFNKEDVYHTYVFEFIHEASAVLTKYKPDQWGLKLLAGRNLQTHKEEDESTLDEIAPRMGAGRPQRWDAVADEAEIARMMNQLASEIEDFEGVVFRDRDTGKRVKLKDAGYVSKHHMIGDTSYKRLIPIVLDGEEDEMLSYFPHIRDRVNKIKERHAEVLHDIVDTIKKMKVEYQKFPSSLSPNARKRELWTLVSSKVKNKFAKSSVMRYIDTDDSELERSVDRDMKNMATTSFEKETYAGNQTFQVATQKYIDLLRLKDDSDADEADETEV
jgi:NEDD4-binding protein 2